MRGWGMHWHQSPYMIRCTSLAHASDDALVNFDNKDLHVQVLAFKNRMVVEDLTATLKILKWKVCASLH